MTGLPNLFLDMGDRLCASSYNVKKRLGVQPQQSVW